MNLGIATPVSLHRLRSLVEDGDKLPQGYLFAPAADWVMELMERGHQVTLYTTAREIDSPTTFCGNGLRIRIAKLRACGTGRDFFRSERDQLTRMMIEDRCDLIHAHWTYEFALAAIASRIPTLSTIHDHPWTVLSHFRDGHRAARLLMAYATAFRGSHFTAVSAGAALHFQRFIRPGIPIDVVPNGLPSGIFALGCRSRCETGDAVRFATILRGWSRLKNAVAALKAFHLLRHEIPGAKLDMFGIDYESSGPAHRWAIAHKVAEGVSFVGALSYEELLQRVSSDIDVLVHPSLNETFSMTILEAMALRKAVVVGDRTSGMHEMLGSEDGGVFVDAANPSAIAGAMSRLALDAGFRTRLAARGFQRASSMYRLDKVISHYEQIYASVLNA